MQETQKTRVRSLGGEGPLEKGMATCSSILAWKILWTEEPGRLQSMWSQTVRHNWLSRHASKHDYLWRASPTHLESTSSQITKGISVLRLPRYNRRHVQDPEPRGLGQSRHESEQESETSIPGREETQLTFSVGWSRLKLLASWGGLLGSREKSKQERVRIWRQIRVLFLIAQGYHHMKDSSLTEA